MKNALILHGTSGSHAAHWFVWLKGQLENDGYKVWVPDLPEADHPNVDRYNRFLTSQDWDFNENSIIVGHSSGAVEILGLLNELELPEGVKLNSCYLVGAFEGDLGWESLKGMNRDFDFAKIKSKARKFIFLHSDNDPHCPLQGAKNLAAKLDGELVVISGAGHFSTNEDARFSEFPELLAIIQQNV